MTLLDDIAKSVGGGVKYALTPFYKAGEDVGRAAYTAGTATRAAIQTQILPLTTSQQAPPKPAATPSPPPPRREPVTVEWIAGIPLFGDVYRAGQKFAAGKTQAEMAERYKSPLGEYLQSRPPSQYLLGVLPKKPGTFVAGLPGAAMETWGAGDVVLSDIITETGVMPEWKPTGGPGDILVGGYEFVRRHPGTAAELPLLGEVIGPVVGAAGEVSPLLGAAVKWGGLGLMGYSTFEKGKEIVEAPPEEQYMRLGEALAEYGLLLGPSAGKYIYEKAPIRPGVERWKNIPSGVEVDIYGIQYRRGSPTPEMYPLAYRVRGGISPEEVLLPTEQMLIREGEMGLLGKEAAYIHTVGPKGEIIPVKGPGGVVALGEERGFRSVIPDMPPLDEPTFVGHTHPGNIPIRVGAFTGEGRGIALRGMAGESAPSVDDLMVLESQVNRPGSMVKEMRILGPKDIFTMKLKGTSLPENIGFEFDARVSEGVDAGLSFNDAAMKALQDISAEAPVRQKFTVKITPYKAGKIGVGTPDLPLRSIMGTEELITTEGLGPGATRILTKAVAGMEGSAEEVGKWTLGREIRAITSRAGVSPGAMRPQFLDVVTEHKLPNPENVADAMIRVMKADMAKGEAGYIYGSNIQRAAGATVGEPGLPGVGRDIDYLANVEKAFKKDMASAVNEAAGQRVATVKGGKILDPAGRTLFDVHEAKAAAELGVGGVSPTPIEAEYIGLGIRAEPKVLTEEGLRSMSPSEQTSRGLIGSTFTVSEAPRTLETPTTRITGRITPLYEGRVKDIGKYYFAEKTNIKALELGGRMGGAAKASTKLEKWLDLWDLWEPGTAAQVREAYAMRVSGGGVEFPTLVSGEEAFAGSMDGMSEVVDILAKAPYPAMVGPALGAARSISPPGLPAPTARLPSPVDDVARTIFYGGEASMGAARRGTAGILERPSPGVSPSPVDRAMREAASLSAFSGAAMERPSPTIRGPVPAGPRVEPSPAPYQRMDEEMSSASRDIFGYPSPREVVSPLSRIPSPEKPYTPRTPPPERPYTPRIPPPERPYTPKTPPPKTSPPERPYTPRTPPPVITTLILQLPEEQKKQKKKEEDEQLKWRRRGARKAVHTYSEIAPGATSEEVMAMIFGGFVPTAQQGRPGVRQVKSQVRAQASQAKTPAKPGGHGKQKARTVEEEAQQFTDQEMRRIWGG